MMCGGRYCLFMYPCATLYDMATKREVPRVYTLDEVAEAARVTRRTIYRWVSAGRIPSAVKIGKQWVLSEAGLRSLLAGMPLAPSEGSVVQSSTPPSSGGSPAAKGGSPAPKKARRK